MHSRWDRIVNHPTKYTPALKVLNVLSGGLLIIDLIFLMMKSELYEMLVGLLFAISAFALVIVVLLDYRARRSSAKHD